MNINRLRLRLGSIKAAAIPNRPPQIWPQLPVLLPLDAAARYACHPFSPDPVPVGIGIFHSQNEGR
jgi:hypothetical protein